MKTIVSETATASGWGSDLYKHVTGLTAEERSHVRAGTARVIVTGCPPSGGGNRSGTRVRMVVDRGEWGFTHRLPDSECEGVAIGRGTESTVAEYVERQGREDAAMSNEISNDTRKAIEYWAASHSYSNGYVSPVAADDDDEARQMARDWQGEDCPDEVEMVDSDNDGNSHDVSTVRYFRAGDLAIYSYNNNAWGHCDVLPIGEDPGSIVEWLKCWDELPEQWLKDLAGIEDSDNE